MNIKSNKGITLMSLVIYIILVSIIVGTMAIVSSFFFSNINLIKYGEQYALEFNKFNMFFIKDIKSNSEATAESSKIVFEDGTTYEYNQSEGKIYRNNKKIVDNVQSVTFTEAEYKVENTNTTKKLITVDMKIDGAEESKKIEYVLKYW